MTKIRNFWESPINNKPLNFKEHIEALIRKGKIKQALEEMVKMKPKLHSEMGIQIDLIACKHSLHTKEKQLGIDSNESTPLVIAKAILEFLNENNDSFVNLHNTS